MKKRFSLPAVLVLLAVCVLLSTLLTSVYVKKSYNTLLAGLPEQAARYEILDELDSVGCNHTCILPTCYSAAYRQAHRQRVA